MYERLKQDMVISMKEQNKNRVTILRGIKAAVDKEHIDNKKEIDDELVIDIVSHQLKTLKDSIKEFEKGNRDDLVEKAENEIKVLSEYLPTQLTEEEVNKIIDEIFEQLKPQSMKDMGIIMKEVTPKVKGRFDMNKISNIVKDKLS